MTKKTVGDLFKEQGALLDAELTLIAYQSWKERKATWWPYEGEHPYEYLCERCHHAHYRNSQIGRKHN